MIKIFTLNLWRYNDFENRINNIVSLIQERKPDVILLQETQIDEQYSAFSQVELIQKRLPEYIYSYHSTIYLKVTQRGERLEKPIQHGMSILSKYPIINFFEYYLESETGDEPRSVTCFDLKTDLEVFKFANIHFNNEENSARKQFVEFLNFLKNRDEARIMVGDFNMYDLPRYFIDLELNKDYIISSDIEKYVSYPEKDWCLDYILVPKKFFFVNIVITSQYLSDHNGIFATIGENKI